MRDSGCCFYFVFVLATFDAIPEKDAASLLPGGGRVQVLTQVS